jgi:GntR family transcriptional regulator, transcriptional repressor for pyruvate dehydrogenase complex
VVSVAASVHSDGDPKNGRIVKPVKVARAYEQLAGLLRERITSGDLREGERLPSEVSLAEQAGVSRSTVREALRTLQEAGLIERASPRVMVVARHAEDPVYRELRHALRRRNVTFHHLHEALLTLEPALTRFAAERADAADIRLLHEAVEEQERNLEHFHEWSRLDEEFHLAVAEMSGNPALIIARAPITQLLVPVLHRFIRSTTHTEHATRYHRRIVNEIEVGDPDTAAAVTRRHVNDFRTAWEKAGLDFHLEIADLGDDGPGVLNADASALWDLQPSASQGAHPGPASD